MEQTVKSYMQKERLSYLRRGAVALMVAASSFLGIYNTFSDFIGGRMRFSVVEISFTTLFALIFIGFGYIAVRSFYLVFSSKSGRLMRSVLSQRTEQNQTVEELFAEIEADLAQNAVVFGKLRIGHGRGGNAPRPCMWDFYGVQANHLRSAVYHL